jgi:hypothetical protein
MDSKPDPVKRKNKALHIVCISVVGVLALLVCVSFMLSRTPAHYKPLHPQNTNEVSRYLTNYLVPEIHNKSQLDEPFEVLIAQQGLNDIIARGPWPIKLNGLTLSDPAVVLSPNQILLMATVKYAGAGVVVTIIMNPRLDETGLLSLNLQHVKTGSVDITPFAMVLAKKIIAAQLDRVDSNNWADDISASLLENKSFDPVFTSYDKQIRLAEINISHSKAILRFEPQ